MRCLYTSIRRHLILRLDITSSSGTYDFVVLIKPQGIIQWGEKLFGMIFCLFSLRSSNNTFIASHFVWPKIGSTKYLRNFTWKNCNSQLMGSIWLFWSADMIKKIYFFFTKLSSDLRSNFFIFRTKMSSDLRSIFHTKMDAKHK